MSGAWGYRWQHLVHMSDERGLMEHALHAEPRPEHGYCTDDNARLLVVTAREPDEGPVHDLSRLALRFVLDSQADSGRVHNRMAFDGVWGWTDAAGVEDWWGRAVWGLGVAAACHPNAGIRAEALWGFHRSARQRSPFVHAMAFAALGAADVLAAYPQDDPARGLLEEAREALRTTSSEWPWPEPRLTYANGAMAEAMIAIGMALPDEDALEQGVRMLDWLMRLQTRAGHLSVVGVGGRGPREWGPQFDQQPIEVAALADAAWRAWLATGDQSWLKVVVAAADWFEGVNDRGDRMYDDSTGGGFDGLTPEGPNLNQGAESTLAYISTMQRARAVRPMCLLVGRSTARPEARTALGA